MGGFKWRSRQRKVMVQPVRHAQFERSWIREAYLVQDVSLLVPNSPSLVHFQAANLQTSGIVLEMGNRFIAAYT